MKTLNWNFQYGLPMLLNFRPTVHLVVDDQPVDIIGPSNARVESYIQSYHRTRRVLCGRGKLSFMGILQLKTRVFAPSFF